MAKVTAPRIVLLAVLLLVALKDIGNADWATRARDADDAGQPALDENLFSENNEESSGLEVDPTEKPTNIEEKPTASDGDDDVTGTPQVVTTERAPNVGGERDPGTEHPGVIEEETTEDVKRPDLGTDEPSAVRAREEEVDIPRLFGEVTTGVLGEDGDGSGLEETTIPPAVTELVTEEDKDAAAQLKTTLRSTLPITDQGPAPDEATASTREVKDTLEPTTAPEATTLPAETTRPEPAETTESVLTDQPTTEASVVEPPTFATPIGPGPVERKATDVPVIEAGGIKSNRSDPCSRTFCRKGYMCEANEDGQSATCRCPSECPQSRSPCCSVYIEEYSSVCEMHKQACGLGINIALRNLGSCADSPSVSQYLPRIVSEGAATTASKCSRNEVIQFASRFQEWAMINKEQAEAADPGALDLNSAIGQARTGGLSAFEKRQILKFQFTTMDLNSDWQLDRSEVEAFLRFVPSEHCLYGFMVSGDVDRNGILSRDEWYGAFDLFQGEDLGINFGKKL